MHFHPTIAAAAGAAFISVAAAGPVCRIKSSPGSGWTPANVPQVQPAPQNPGNNGGWSNWDGSPVNIRTTTMVNTLVNPQPTGGPRWGGWNGNPGSGGSVAPVPGSATSQGQVWAPWNTFGGSPTQTLTLSSVTSTSGSGVVLPTAGTTTATTTTTSGTGIVSPTLGTTTTLSTITTAPTSTTTATTTTTTTTTTTSPTCPDAPAGTFYLQAQNAENTALNNLYAGLANNGFGNLVAFYATDLADAVQVTFNADCNIVSALGPLIILDEDTTPAPVSHYQYLNEEGTQAAGTTRSLDICSADAAGVVSCSVNGQNVLQTSDDILTIGDALYFQAVSVVLVPV